MMQTSLPTVSFNSLRAVNLDAHIPMVYMVGQFGREFTNLGQPATASARTMVRVAEPFLASIGVPYYLLDSAADMGRLDMAFEHAERERTAVVLLVSAPMAWN
jgi:sulfopyruvate decarboxylase subunit alpha